MNNISLNCETLNKNIILNIYNLYLRLVYINVGLSRVYTPKHSIFFLKNHLIEYLSLDQILKTDLYYLYRFIDCYEYNMHALSPCKLIDFIDNINDCVTNIGKENHNIIIYIKIIIDNLINYLNDINLLEIKFKIHFNKLYKLIEKIKNTNIDDSEILDDDAIEYNYIYKNIHLILIKLKDVIILTNSILPFIKDIIKHIIAFYIIKKSDIFVDNMIDNDYDGLTHICFHREYNLKMNELACNFNLKLIEAWNIYLSKSKEATAIQIVIQDINCILKKTNNITYINKLECINKVLTILMPYYIKTVDDELINISNLMPVQIIIDSIKIV